MNQMEWIYDKRGYFVSYYTNDSGDFYQITPKCNGGMMEWFVRLLNNNEKELAYIGLYRSFDLAEQACSE